MTPTLREDDRPLPARILEAIPPEPAGPLGWAKYKNECAEFVGRLRAALAAPAAVAQAEPVAAVEPPPVQVFSDGSLSCGHPSPPRISSLGKWYRCPWCAAAPPPPERAAPEAMPTDAQIEDVLAGAYKAAVASGAWNGGMAGAGWDLIAARAIIAARDAQWLAQHAAAPERAAPEAMPNGKVHFEHYAHQMGVRDFEETSEDGIQRYTNPRVQEKWAYWRASRDALAQHAAARGGVK